MDIKTIHAFFHLVSLVEKGRHARKINKCNEIIVAGKIIRLIKIYHVINLLFIVTSLVPSERKESPCMMLPPPCFFCDGVFWAMSAVSFTLHTVPYREAKT